MHLDFCNVRDRATGEPVLVPVSLYFMLLPAQSERTVEPARIVTFAEGTLIEQWPAVSTV